MIGYTLDELQPISIQTWERFAHPEDLKISSQKLKDCFEKKSDYYDCECRMKHKEGHWIWVLDKGKVISWTKEGLPLMMFGTHTDITETKTSELKLEEMAKKFQGIFDSTFQFIGFLNPDGILLEANQTAMDFAGLSKEDLIGKPFWECYW
ncbi:PAS domain S-box-containing protein [Belliella buryatensis]|uniref:histidine kinase n=1 Tax=Belliella buryatensis TaxID=1500549 RepID=A0A239GMT4_9BACT|nr:PAS domain S-box-containing protein [Belliella buryatensis]